MNKKTVFAIVEWALIALLVWLVFREQAFPVLIGSSSPEKAFRQSESTYHYGPSTILRKVEVPGDDRQVIFLSKYKDWFSAHSVIKGRIGWRPGGGVAGVKIKPDKPLTYSWEGHGIKDGRMLLKFYGYVPDDRISTVELLKTDVETGKAAPLMEKLNADRMFLFRWEEESSRWEWSAIRGLDSNGQVVYEQKLN
ncbi:hypothetical protein ACFPPD_26640 [Cohnella suwonensis]|uniref:DUF5643 domain-containing protein n=1 Tax=Cohnella suwonensis TaxID=696072 RepID=A0ABW0M527_9BACL